MFHRAKILYSIGLMFIVFNGLAQPMKLRIIVSDTSMKENLQVQTFLSETELKKQLQKELLFWQKQNFLEVSFDSIIQDSASYLAYLHLGKQYKIVQSGKPWDKQKHRMDSYNSTHYAYWVKSIENKIKVLEQSGYPFVQVSVKKECIVKKTLSIQFNIDSGQYITYDSLIITGNAVQDKNFMMQYLNINVNTPYNEEVIKQLDKRLRQLPYLKVARPSSVYFYRNKAQVTISIDDKPSNNFEGILGIRNDELNANKYKVSGDVNLQLNNLLGSAASLKLQWRSFAAQNSDINAIVNYPSIIGAPIAIMNEFSLFRQDSNFQRLRNVLGFGYLFGGLNTLQFYYSYEKSTASLTTQQLEEALAGNRLPAVNDYLNRSYGTKVIYKNLDNLYSPSSGINLISDLSIGTHQVLENALLKGARDSQGRLFSAYDSLPKSQNTIQLFNFLDYYYPLTHRHVINVFMQGASMLHARIFYNEQFQLGGLRTFRGVNELSIKATSYLMARIEYRYILPQTGYFNLFCNQVWYESNIVNAYSKQTLLGFGGGLGLQTKGGILTVIYALANENGFVFKVGKVHLGFTAVF